MSPPHVAERDEFARLRSSEERLRLAVEAAGIGTCDWNILTGEVIWSGAKERLFGLAPGSFPGTRDAFTRLIHPADLDFVLRATAACLHEGLTYDVEFRAVAPDGSVRWISERAEVLRDSTGAAVRWLGAARDITHRKRAAQRLAVQSEVTRILAESSALREAAPRMLQIICETLDWDTGAVWAVENGSLDFVDLWERPLPAHLPFEAATPNLRFACGVKLPGHVWKTGESFWVADLESDDSFLRSAAARQPGLRTGFGFPFRIGSEVAGVMEFFCRDVRHRDEELLQFCGSIGEQIGQAIERMRAQEALRRSYQVERDLHQRAERAGVAAVRLQAVTAALSRALTLEEVSEVIVTDARAALGAGMASVYTLNPDGAVFTCLRSEGLPDPVPYRLRSLPADAPLMIADAVRRRELIAFSTPGERRERYPHREWIEDCPCQAVAAAPLFVRDRAIGAVGFAFETECSFDGEARALLLNVAGQCAQALDRAQLYERRIAGLHALHASETRFRHLVESGAVAVLFGESDRITGANSRFLETIGYSSDELLTGALHWDTITPPEFRDLDRRALAELNERGVFTPYQTEYLRKDGRRIPVLIAGAGLEPRSWVCFVVDLSEVFRKEQQRLRAQKLESLSVLAGGIAHEFNNSLTSVIGNASLARDLAPEGDIRSLLGDVVTSGLAASHLVRQMQAYAGGGRVWMQPADLARLVAALEPSIRVMVPERISLRIEAGRPVPEVMADASQIEHLVTNLVANAVEAIEPQAAGTICVTVAAERLAEDSPVAGLQPGLYAALRVEDSGCGMDDQTMAKVFDPFFSTKFTGRGLGLAAASGIVRTHRGAIHLASRPGAGSAFTVYLPATASLQSQ